MTMVKNHSKRLRHLRFPPGFEWGAATAAYQIEGAVAEGGRGASIWDTFCRQPDAIARGDTGDVACDHYHRFESDVAIMKSLGLMTYRFSIAWPRVLPTGSGSVNEVGLDFYSRLIDKLLDANITPCATLYHWDLPQALQDLGGWMNRDTAGRFAEYASLVFDRFSDRVKRWITLNEPMVAVTLGHLNGQHAPGISDLGSSGRALHHMLLGHGLAVKAFRASAAPGEIGLANADVWVEPADATDESKLAVERALDFRIRLFHDPVFGRGYPARVESFYASRGCALPIESGDMDIIACPVDFIGVNLYGRAVVRAADNGVGFREVPATLPTCDLGWEITPYVLGAFVAWLDREYGRPPIYITENGMCDGTPAQQGVVGDARRVELLRGMLAGLHAAILEGADVRGYYVWSLLDNFEWAVGYAARFGLVWVNFETQERIPKDSAVWFREVIRQNGPNV